MLWVIAQPEQPDSVFLQHPQKQTRLEREERSRLQGSCFWLQKQGASRAFFLAHPSHSRFNHWCHWSNSFCRWKLGKVSPDYCPGVHSSQQSRRQAFGWQRKLYLAGSKSRLQHKRGMESLERKWKCNFVRQTQPRLSLSNLGCHNRQRANYASADANYSPISDSTRPTDVFKSDQIYKPLWKANHGNLRRNLSR